MTDFIVSRPVARYLVRQPMGSEHEVDVVPGLRHEMVQAFDMVLSKSNRANLCTVVVSTLPTLSEHDRSVIAQALEATRRPELAFLVESSPGGSRAECPDNADFEAMAAAIAVLGASRSRTHDELATQVVTINGRSLDVSTAWDGRNWQCQVG